MSVPLHWVWRTITPSGMTGGLVLALVALVDAALAWKIGARAVLPAFLYFGSMSVLVAVVDAKEGIVPNRIVLPSYVVLAILLALGAGADHAWGSMRDSAVAMVVFVAAFTVLALLRKGGLGAGDIKLAGLVGLAVGFFGVTSTLLTFVLAFVVAAVVLIALRFRGRQLARVAFGPMMATGAVLAILLH